MASITPAYCKNCRGLFVSQFSIAGSKSAAMFRNAETCIYCGGLAYAVDGVFDGTDGLIKLVSGPQFTKDILEAFASLIEQAKAGKITETELATRAESLSPELGAAVKGLSGLKRWPVLLLALAALQQCKMEIKLDVKLDANDLLRQTIELVDKSRAKGDAKGAQQEKKGGNADPTPGGAKGKNEDVSHGWKTSVHPEKN